MTGSVAEERIRLRTEAALREAWPSARIVHELVMEQNGCRADLAAITAERIIAVEIKSERDVLDRLERQLAAMRRACDAVLVVAAGDHMGQLHRRFHLWSEAASEDEVERACRATWTRAHEATTNAPARLAMLWASELRVVCRTSAKAARRFSILHGSDGMTGREVRVGVCAALRARVFPRADPPILSDLFPAPMRSER